MKNTEEAIATYIVESLLKDKAVAKALAELEKAIIMSAPLISRNLIVAYVKSIVKPSLKNSVLNVQNEGKYVSRRKTQYDWSLMSDAAVRLAYYYRYKRGLNIEDELSNELRKRFPEYDEKTRTLRRAPRVKDWTKLSDDNLKCILYTRKRFGKPIEDALQTELIKRFPSYDKENKKFNRIFQKKDLSIIDDDRLKKLFYNLKSNKKVIDESLNTELSKRFSSYDPINQRFIRIRHKKKKDWSTANDAYIKVALYRCKKYGMPIDVSLQNELIKRFPSYDAANQIFIRKPKKSLKKQPKMVQQQYLDVGLKVPLFSVLTGKGKYNLCFGKEYTTARLLSGSNVPYHLVFFDEVSNFAIVRKKRSVNNFVLYVINLKTGNVLQESKSGVKIIKYMDKSHELFLESPSACSYIVISPYDTNRRVKNVPAEAGVINAKGVNTNTVIISKNCGYLICPLIEIGELSSIESNNKLINSLLKEANQRYKIENLGKGTIEEFATNNKKESIPQLADEKLSKPNVTPENIIDYSEDGLLRIKIKHIKTTLNGVYNEVWVNGNKLLPRHINTEIKLFCDDTVLAIHGILENNSDYPSTPMWLVYDTNLRLRLPKSRNIFSGYYVYAKSVHQLLDMMRLDIDNKTQIYFRNDLMKKIAEGKKFVLEKVK